MNQIDEIKELTKELLQYCHEYYDLDSPTISDAEYDKKFDALKSLEDETGFYLTNSPTRKVQGEVLPYLEKVKHTIPMLSADKSTNIEDVKRFIAGKEVIVSYKLDGATVVLRWNHHHLELALSRGSGYEGEVITHTAKMIKNLPAFIPYDGYLEIRGEALIPWKYYNIMNKDGSLGHPRNVASGGLRQLDANEAARRNIYFYAFTLVNWKDIGVTTKDESLKFLKNNGFDVVPYVTVPEQGNIEDAIKALNRETYENPTDGHCFEFNNLAYGESLGSTEHHDRKLYALKPATEEHLTHFRGIEYRTCRTGIVSMTAMFDEINIGNTNVSRCTLHNVDFFNSFELGEGDEISVTKFNEIIPGIVENHTRSGNYKLIDTCPSCGTKLEIKNTGSANVLYCPNEDCPSRHLAKFTHFVSKHCMDINGMSEATLEALISHGFIHKYSDIYHLSAHRQQLMQLDGFGKKSIDNLLKSIEDSRNVKLDNFITALGIDGIGASASKTISKYCNGSYDKFYDLAAHGSDWTTLEDFGEVMCKNLNKYLSEHLSEIEKLAGEMHFMLSEKSDDNSLANLKFCITGSFAQPRDALKAQLEARGAKFISSVSKNLNILFCGDKAGSKLTKAQQLGVKIAYEDELMKMLQK